MTVFWWRPLAALAYTALFSIAAWAVSGRVPALVLASAILLLLFLQNLRHLSALTRWLKNPQANTVPDSFGLWEEAFSGLYRLMRQQTYSQQSLSSALERFQNAAQAIPDGVVVLNEVDQIEWCNPVAQTHLGIDNDRDRGRQLSYLLRAPAFIAFLENQSIAEPLVFKSPLHHDITLSAQQVPFGDHQRLLITRDITQMEKVETMRRDFIANISHELRTPLTVVGGFLETMLDMDRLDADTQHGYFQLMQDQTRRMQRLIEDLLTLSRLESAQNNLKEEKVNVPRLLQILLNEATTLSGGRHQLTLHTESDRWLLGNENELRSAFGNLVSNAIRYTPAGGEISMHWKNRGENMVFAVSDTGEGIDPGHISRLTERFYRIDRSRSRETGGTGLGLSIVKHVLTRHQARLEITSALGQGSTFNASFPAQRTLAPEKENH